MNGCEYVLPDKSFVQENGILVVVSFPCHKTDKRIFAKRDLSVRRCGTVCEHLTFCDFFTYRNDRPLIYTCALIRALELDELVFMLHAACIDHIDVIGVDECHGAVILGNNADSGINRGFVFHAGADKRTFGLEERYGLSLHIRSHKSAVCVVVFKEWDHGSGDRYDHFRRNIHEIHFFAVTFEYLVFISRVDFFSRKSAVFRKRLVGLGNYIIVLNIGCHIDNFICHDTGRLVDFPVGRLDKAVLVYSRESGKIGYKTDIRPFGGLYGAHSSIVAVMNVTDFKSGSVPRKSSGTECRKTPLMSKFGKRVVLIHEL